MAISERMSERDERLAPLALYEQMSGLGSARRLPGLATLALTLIPTLPAVPAGQPQRTISVAGTATINRER